MAKSVNVKMELRAAAAIRQILFEHQKGYSYEFVPERVVDIRKAIQEIDTQIEKQVKE